MRIGYFVPEFPGQTHAFFWRELAALHESGVQTDIISTRRPPRKIVSHEWSEGAVQQTTYLGEGFFRSFITVAAELIRSGPLAWVNCLRGLGSDQHGLRLRQIGLLLLGARLAATARHRGWRHVHVQSCADSANIAMAAALLSGLTYSLALHGPLKDYGGNQRSKWKYASFCIVITERLLAEVRSTLGTDVPERIRVSSMGVDPISFARSRPYQCAISGRPLRIFSCGRLNPCKGHVNLIEAIALLRRAGVDAHLEIAGEDEQGGSGYHLELGDFIRARGLSDYVTLLGAVSETRIRNCLEGSHLFVLLSIAEPLGVAIMEAMAMEVPVIATASGGVPELITHGCDGILVPPDDPQAAADQIRQLAMNSESAMKIGAAGRLKIVEQFNSKQCAATLISLLPGFCS